MLFQLELRNIVPAEKRRNANLAYKIEKHMKTYAFYRGKAEGKGFPGREKADDGI